MSARNLVPDPDLDPATLRWAATELASQCSMWRCSNEQQPVIREFVVHNGRRLRARATRIERTQGKP